MPPTYDLAEFYQACKDDGVYVRGEALIGANKGFNLRTEKALLQFIGNSSLENVAFVNTETYREWRQAPPPPPPMVDSYTFTSGPIIEGYLAFLKSPINGVWWIKSFKKNTERGEYGSPLLNLGDLLRPKLEHKP